MVMIFVRQGNDSQHHDHEINMIFGGNDSHHHDHEINMIFVGNDSQHHDHVCQAGQQMTGRRQCSS